MDCIHQRCLDDFLIFQTMTLFSQSPLPILKWPGKYKKKWFLDDIVAGLILSSFAIPQGMSYAVLANLPPVWGLYTCIFPGFIYLLFGSTEVISFGVFAITSLLVGSSVSSSNELLKRELSSFNPNAPYMQMLAPLLTFAVGLLLMLFYVARIPKLLNRFLGKTMIHAFTVGCAFAIITSQIKLMLGISIPSVTSPFVLPSTWYLLFTGMYKTNLVNLATGISVMILLYLLEFGSERLNGWLNARKRLAHPNNEVNVPQQPVFVFIPCVLIALVIITIVSFSLKLPDYSVAIVGAIPSGFPGLTIPWKIFGILNQELTTKIILKTIPESFSLALVIHITNLAVLQSCDPILPTLIYPELSAAERLEAVEMQELLNGCLTALIVSFLSCFVPSGSLSRSILLFSKTKGKSPLSAVFSSLVILSIVLFLSASVYYIPMCALGAVIIYSLIPTIFTIRKSYLVYIQCRKNYKEARQSGELNFIRILLLFQDFLIYLATFLAVIVLDATWGIAVGLGLSFIMFAIEKILARIHRRISNSPI
jgi:SulP family sulfate permease